jgi:hypothetical protein
MRPSNQTWERTWEKERWRYEWKAREMMMVIQGLFRMRGSREVRRKKEQTKVGKKGERQRGGTKGEVEDM